MLAAAGILVSCGGNSEKEDSSSPYSLGLTHEFETTERCGHCERIERRFLFNLDTSGEAFLMYRHTIEFGTVNGDEIQIDEFAGRAKRYMGISNARLDGKSQAVQSPLIIEAYSYDSSQQYYFWVDTNDFWTLDSKPDSVLSLQKKWVEMN